MWEVAQRIELIKMNILKSTPDFFPSIADKLRTLEIMEIEINNDI